MAVDGAHDRGSGSDERAYDALGAHPQAAKLASLAGKVMADAAQSRRAERRAEDVDRLATEVGLTREEAGTEFGNAIDVLGRGPEDAAERSLARALAARSVAIAPPADEESGARVAVTLLWLGTHTPFDATGLIDHALGPAAGPLWEAIADRIRRVDDGTLHALGRGEALLAASALVASSAEAPRRRAASLANEVADPRLALVLRSRRDSPAPALTGEMAPVPRGPAATTVLALSGLLLLFRGGRLLARLVLAMRLPAEVTLGPDRDVLVRWRVEMLGRTLREREVLLPRSSIARAVREVRYPRLSFYAGLLSLATGSYLGVSSIVDGMRAGSLTLLAWGLLVVAVGVGLDVALTTLVPGVRGRCRVVFVPRRGAPVCVGGVDIARADALAARLSGR
jgi:hypothetical protein